MNNYRAEIEEENRIRREKLKECVEVNKQQSLYHKTANKLSSFQLIKL